MITHLLNVKQEAAKYGLTTVMAKLCSSLLRYTKEIRADKAYYDAGTWCRKAG
jgi:hypothetical protein